MISPPKWADRFLAWYCNPDLLEEVQGDAHELFYRRVKNEGAHAAKRKFVWDVLRFFRWSNIKRTTKTHSSNSFTMFKSYLKLGFRNAVRNGLTSSINLIGLSIALGVAITIYTFVNYQYNMDSFHENKDRIYQITNIVKQNEGHDMGSNWGDSPMLLGPTLLEDNPAIESFTRIEYGSGSFRYNEIVFNESIWFVDPDYMTMFDFEVLYGNPLALENKNEIIITKAMSDKFFGNRNPIGEIFSIKFTNEVKEEFVVGAVLQTLPGNSGIRFDNLISLEAFHDLKLKDANDWEYFTDATFIMLKEGHNVSEVAGHMDKYKTIQSKANIDWPIQDFKFYSLNGLSGKSFEIDSEVSQGAHPAGLITLAVISLLLLLLACFNYMNVAVATVTTRLKEIGIRKVVGGRKKEIIMQFLTENLVLCGAAVLLGTILAYLFLMPGLNSLFPISVSFSSASASSLLIFFVSILIFVGLISGVYPALYIASFQPVQILRGKEKFGSKSLFSRILLTAQFMLAFITIIGSFVFIANSINLRNKDWGYAHNQNIAVPVINDTNYKGMRDFVSQDKNILSYAGSKTHIGDWTYRATISYHENKKQVVIYEVGFNYLETMNLRLSEGRFFDESIQSDKEESAVVNSIFVEEMGWENPIGQSFEYDSVKRFVVGVVENFHYDDFYSSVDPVMFLITPEENYKYIVMKAQVGSLVQIGEKLKEVWRQVAPDDPYAGYYQDSVFEGFHNDNNSNIKLLGFISAVAVLLACIGLFGLVSYNITRRMKEFSVRKVFGASIANIFKLMNRDYIWILLIAFTIGAPGGFFLVNSLIQNIYPDPTPATPTPFVIGMIIMMITVAITVTSQISRITKNNPADVLRNE